MAAFAYTAVTADGKEKKGSIEAKDEERVKVLLRDKNLIPISISEQNIFTKDINISIGKKVSLRDLSVFCRQFASILRAGVTVIEALEMLGQQTENKIFAKAIQDTRASVEKGETLSDSMRLQKHSFPPLLINMVEAGEASGSLEITFNRMAVQFEKSSKLRGKVKSAMTYPIVILILALVILMVMSVVVVPQFATMFTDMGTELPLITKMVMALSDFIMNRWYLLLLSVVVLLVVLRTYKNTENGKIAFGKLSISLPLFGKLAVKNACASFARTLATLVSSGISVSEALDITARSMKNLLFQRTLYEVRMEVERGVSMSEPIRRSGLFPPMMSQMLKIGEETGNIEGMLEKTAEYYEEEVETATDGLTKAMEPMLIIVMGVIVAFMVLALYMPMISMYGEMGNL